MHKVGKNDKKSKNHILELMKYNQIQIEKKLTFPQNLSEYEIFLNQILKIWMLETLKIIKKIISK